MSDVSSDIRQAVNNVVRTQLDALSHKSFDELAELPSHFSEELLLQEKKIILTVWHDVIAPQNHRIVVQAYKPGMLGVGCMYADGFVINSLNEKRKLTLEEWAPFS